MSLFFINLDREEKKRFGMSKFMEFANGDNFDPITSDFILRLQALKLGGEYKVQNEEGRADLLSFKIYQDTQYWWALLLYNGITEVNQLTSGLTIRYPSLGELENLFFSLKAKEQARSR